jgi:hypothetical protein
MKVCRPPRSRAQIIFLAVIGGLALLAILLWFADPSHRSAGPSRIDWPVSARP